MYLVEFDNNLTSFKWSKVPIDCTGPRAYHSSTFIPNLNSVAICGGVTCGADGQCVRQNLDVTLVNISNWSWNKIKFKSNDICLSSTKMLLVGENTLAYFGGYTSKLPSRKQQENSKSSYWGTIEIRECTSSSQFFVNLEGKGTQLTPFACSQAIKIGSSILLSCGTEQKWAVCSSVKQAIEQCDIPQCTANRGLGTLAGFENWIRSLIILNCSWTFIWELSCHRCESSCRRWLHYNCAGLTQEDVNALAPGSKWQCRRSDCNRNVQQPKATPIVEKPALFKLGSLTVPFPSQWGPHHVLKYYCCCFCNCFKFQTRFRLRIWFPHSQLREVPQLWQICGDWFVMKPMLLDWDRSKQVVASLCSQGIHSPTSMESNQSTRPALHFTQKLKMRAPPPQEVAPMW